MATYETIIGLEVHVELATDSKIFCGCSTEFGGEPNTHCCPVCLGHPGTLPVLNKKVLEYAMAAGLAMDCTITRFSHFDRKNYFYPDLPKAYQVSQLYLPIARNGRVEISVKGEKKSIGIHEIHMEEDAGKLMHDPMEDMTSIDYNRSGVPLIEIVSAPDLRSAEEVIAYLDKIKLILQYLGVSDCKMQEGSLRADINLSVREMGSKTLGTRTEMKNMNSFKAIARAIEGERDRQIALLEEGKVILQETRRWEDHNKKSVAMRSKEDARDYRYFPEPDLVPLEISDAWIEEIRKRQPELPEEKRERYIKEYQLPSYDASILTSSKALADLFEETTAFCPQPKEISNWIMGDTMRLLKEAGKDPEDMSISPKSLASVIQMVLDQKINRTVAREVFEKVFYENIDPEEYVNDKGLAMVNDEHALRENITKILVENPQSVSDYLGGKKKALAYLMGQTMKAMGGKADPGMVNAMLKELIEKE